LLLYILDSNYYGDIIFNGELLNIENIDIIPNDISKETFEIIDKVIKYNNIQTLFNSQGHFNIKTNDNRFLDEGDIKCFVSKQKGLIKYLNNIDLSGKKVNRWKLAIPSASGKGGMLEEFYNRIEIIKPFDVCSESFIFFDFDSEKELLSFKSYLETRFFSFLVRLRKIKQHVTSDIFKWVPLITFDREWTDELLFDYFELSEEERNIILNYDNNRK